MNSSNIDMVFLVFYFLFKSCNTVTITDNKPNTKELVFSDITHIEKSSRNFDTLNCKECTYYYEEYNRITSDDITDEIRLDDNFLKCGLKKKCYEFWCIYSERMLFVYFENKELALSLLNEANENGIEKAGFILSKFYIAERNMEKAFTLLINLTERNFAPAKFEMASIYLDAKSHYLGSEIYNGNDFIDLSKGLLLLDELVQDGMFEAQYKLGVAYKLGLYNLEINSELGDSLLLKVLNNPILNDIPGMRDDVELYLNNEKW